MLSTHRKGYQFAALTAVCAVMGMAAAAQGSSATEQIYKSLFSGQRKTENQQKRSRANTAVMGIRGLDSDKEQSEKLSANANMRAVYEMEDRAPDSLLVEEIKKATAGRNSSGEKFQGAQPIANEVATTDELKNEIDLGRKMAAQILGSSPVLNNQKIQAYVNALTAVVAAGGLSSARPFRVAVLDSQQINAFACPGGYIFITRGAIEATRSESQLSAVLGHEIAHVSKRHLLSSMRKKIAKPQSEKAKKMATDPHIEKRQRIRPNKEGEASALSQLLGPKGVGLTLLQASSEALETLLSRGLEQEFELEADSLGSQITSAAGFNARGLIELLETIRNDNRKDLDSSSQTHPAYELRLNQLTRFIGTLPLSSHSQHTESDLYLEMRKELLKK